VSATTIVTLNLRSRLDRWLARRELVVAQLLDLVPDIICLQEIYLPVGQARWLRNQINLRLTGGSNAPYKLVQTARRHWWHGRFDGIGMLCRLPVVAQDTLDLGYEGRVALRLNIELASGESVDVVNVHLHHLSEERQARLEQVVQLTGWLADRHPAPYQIVAGDFNETPDGPAIRQMKQSYRSAFEEKVGHEPLATFPTALRRDDVLWSGCLDYIFLSPAVHRVLAARLCCHRAAADDDALYPSDHVGLLARLEIEPPSPF
jgi:endonuclease/exonuclease/phosphatase family metal-dependent hydrolase